MRRRYCRVTIRRECESESVWVQETKKDKSPLFTNLNVWDGATILAITKLVVKALVVKTLVLTTLPSYTCFKQNSNIGRHYKDNSYKKISYTTHR